VVTDPLMIAWRVDSLGLGRRIPESLTTIRKVTATIGSTSRSQARFRLG
jgi:hypothetical protein